MTTEQEFAVEPRRSGNGRRTQAILLAVAVVAVIASSTSFVRYRNDLVALETRVSTQWVQIETQILRQSELIPNLVEVTRAYAQHELEIFTEIADARTHFSAAPAPARVTEGAAMQASLGRLLAVAEAYPQLSADRTFRDLSIELAGTQNRIALERQRYNETVGLYNARLRMFPWMLVASGFEPKAYFEMPDDTPTKIVVDL